jgi:hypothetical protein
LQQVIIKTGSAIRIKGDTTIYTADSFSVSANANVEELLKKLPGIQVDKNGEIKAMGEKVAKVLVDGEEFFGDDPGMAVKNLRADAVKEVQVFDKKSEQAEFTGIDDGQSSKTINLKLKENKKRGYFGKIDASGGPTEGIDPRYNSNILFSSFKGKRKLSAYVLNGNTGQDGLDWQDQEKFGGGEDNYSMSMDDNGEVSWQWTGGNNDDEPYMNPQNGFTINNNLGLQYSNKWNDKHTLNVTPKYNNRRYNNVLSSIINSQFGDSVLNEIGNVITNVDAANFRLNGSYDVKLDSNNSLKVTARTTWYETQSKEFSTSSTTGGGGQLKNNSDKTVNVTSDKTSYFGSVLYRHKFKKARRTISLNASWNLLTSDASNTLVSNNNIYKSSIISSNQKLNQNRISSKSTTNVLANIAYTEPINKNYALELSYQLTANSGYNNQATFNYSSSTGIYDDKVDSLSNNFYQNIIINKPTFRVSYNTKKLKYSFGSGFGITNFDFEDRTLGKNYVRNFTNFFPSATVTYNYKSNSSIRFNYNGNTSQPNINDLQPLRNNTNFFNQFIGDPNLKASFTNNLRLSHNSYNFLKDFSLYQSINFSNRINAISYSTITDLDSGKTIRRPVNINGNYSFNFYGGTWFKLKKIDLQVGINPSFSFVNNNSLINSKAVSSKTANSSISLNFSKDKEKKYDVSMNHRFSNSRNRNSLNNQVTSFNTYNLEVWATLYYKKTWSINMDYDYFVRQKTANFQTNLSNQIWNARIQKTFKKDEFTVYVAVRDILNQNIGIDRNFSDNTFMEFQNTRLKRYGMIGFTWNFKNKAKVTATQ